VKLILDEMLSASIADQLRLRGHDVVAVVEHALLCGLSDAELLAFAETERRALVTYDLDFLYLDEDYRGREEAHSGIVMLHSRRFPQGSASNGKLVKSLDRLVALEPPYPSFVHWLQ
jgi:uncharacterized protein DUF5615